jgi:hypothetical protein
VTTNLNIASGERTEFPPRIALREEQYKAGLNEPSQFDLNMTTNENAVKYFSNRV